MSLSKGGPVVEVEPMENKTDSANRGEPMDQSEAALAISEVEPLQRQYFQASIESSKDEPREEKFPHDDQCSQTSSLNASTIAGEREPESANVSMCSGTDDSATSQDTEDAMETEMDPHYAEETRQDMETETIHVDDATAQILPICKPPTSEDKMEEVSTVPLSKKEEAEKKHEKTSKENIVQRTSDIGKQPTDVFESSDDRSNIKAPRIKLAITKKDVAKQFQAIDAAAKVAASAVVAPDLSLKTKSLEVVTAELPAQLLTESKEAVTEAADCKDEGKADSPLATSSPQKQSVTTEVELQDEKEYKEKDGDEIDDDDNENVTQAPKENESQKSSEVETQQEQSATNFDFSQVL